MTARQWIRVLLTVVVYVTAIGLGGSIFVADPTDVLVAVPVVSGLLLVVHAARTTHLDELGYAIVGMWAAVLAASVGVGVVEQFVLPGRPTPIAPTDAVGTVVITAVLVAGYALALNRRRGSSRTSHLQ